MNPSDSDAYNNKGISLCNLERYHEAIEFYSKAIELHPTSSVYNYNKGNVLNELKRYQEAIEF